MVDIIKSEDLTLDEIKSRIISLDSRFAQGEFRFVKHSYAYDSFMGPNQTEGLSEFTHLLTQRANSQSIYPEHLNEACKAIESRELIDEDQLDTLEEVIEYLESSLEPDDDSSLLFTCDTIVNFDEDDLSEAQVVSIPAEFEDSEYEEFVDELRNSLTHLKDVLSTALSASQELGDAQLTNDLTESLSVCEELTKYFADQLGNVDVDSVTQQEFEICEIEIDDEEVEKYESIYL